MPIVSVIIPAHNRRAFLEEALSSVLAQTYQDIEAIVVDDGSNDGTAEFLEDLGDERVKFIRTEHLGPASARNAAAGIAQGKFLAFCDSDDIWSSDKLEKQLPLFECDPRPVLVFSNAAIFDSGRKSDETVFDNQKPLAGSAFDALTLDNFIPTSSVILAKEVFDQTGGFEDRFCPAEDYRLWLRSAKIGTIDYLEEPLVKYRRHPGQLGNDRTRMFPICAEVILDALKEEGMEVQALPGLPMRLWRLHFVAGRLMARSERGPEAREQYRACLGYRNDLFVRLLSLLSRMGI
jgi:glycosyltransferase involved in cell wall biosynthesis